MRVLAAFTAAFSAGIFLAQYAIAPAWLLLWGIGAWLLAFFGRLLLRGNAGRRVLLIGTGLAVAFGYQWLYVRQVQRPAQALDGAERETVMTLCGYAVPGQYGTRASVRLEGIPGKAVYYGTEALLELEPGQTVTDTVYLQDAGQIRDEDITAFSSKGVFLLAYQRGTPVYGAGSTGSVRWWPVRVGRAMRERIALLFDGDTAGFLSAILTGDRTGLGVRISAALSEAGLSHILAVSGMHCGFLLAAVTFFTGAQRRRLTALCAIPLLIFYALVTGASPSVLRACWMLGFYLTAPLFDRESDGCTALFAALFFILLVNPFAAASLSLQLSFAAMAGILFLAPRLYRLLAGERGRLRRTLAAGVSSALGALVFTAPLCAWYFETLTLIAPISSLLCLWAASAVFLLGLAAVLLSFVCLPLARLLAVLPSLLARYIFFLAGLLGRLPYHAVYSCDLYLKIWLVFAYVLFGVVWLRRERSRRTYALAAVCVLLSLTAAVWTQQRRYCADLDGKMLNVGQGQCILLASDGEFALVDCGSGNSWLSPGETAARHLRAMGCQKLDRLILTHYDTDHSNGVEELLARIPVKTLLVPQAEGGEELLALAQESGTSVEVIEERTVFPMGRACVTVMPPMGEGESNERGLAVLASAGDADLLITGDMNKATERMLLETWPLPEIEVLAVGHHGSKYSTSEELLTALRPENACISVGTNRYGHPADETLRALTEHGCGIYRTDLQGSIHFTLNH